MRAILINEQLTDALLIVLEVEVYALRVAVEDQKRDRAKPGCGYGPYGAVDFHCRFLTSCCCIGVSGTVAFLRARHYYIRGLTVYQFVSGGYFYQRVIRMTLFLSPILTEAVCTCNHHKIVMCKRVMRKINVPVAVGLFVEF